MWRGILRKVSVINAPFFTIAYCSTPLHYSGSRWSILISPFRHCLRESLFWLFCTSFFEVFFFVDGCVAVGFGAFLFYKNWNIITEKMGAIWYGFCTFAGLFFGQFVTDTCSDREALISRRLGDHFCRPWTNVINLKNGTLRPWFGIKTFRSRLKRFVMVSETVGQWL